MHLCARPVQTDPDRDRNFSKSDDDKKKVWDCQGQADVF